jgi:hypothetical protein
MLTQQAHQVATKMVSPYDGYSLTRFLWTG